MPPHYLSCPFQIVVVLVVTLLGEAAPAATHVIVAIVVALTLAYLLHYRPIMEPKARASGERCTAHNSAA